MMKIKLILLLSGMLIFTGCSKEQKKYNYINGLWTLNSISKNQETLCSPCYFSTIYFEECTSKSDFCMCESVNGLGEKTTNTWALSDDQTRIIFNVQSGGISYPILELTKTDFTYRADNGMEFHYVK